MALYQIRQSVADTTLITFHFVKSFRLAILSFHPTL